MKVVKPVLTARRAEVLRVHLMMLAIIAAPRSIVNRTDEFSERPRSNWTSAQFGRLQSVWFGRVVRLYPVHLALAGMCCTMVLTRK